MDVHGFTELSSRVSAPELAELIQSLFVSIDYAAECVGQVWKVPRLPYPTTRLLCDVR